MFENFTQEDLSLLQELNSDIVVVWTDAAKKIGQKIHTNSEIKFEIINNLSRPQIGLRRHSMLAIVYAYCFVDDPKNLSINGISIDRYVYDLFSSKRFSFKDEFSRKTVIMALPTLIEKKKYLFPEFDINSFEDFLSLLLIEEVEIHNYSKENFEQMCISYKSINDKFSEKAVLKNIILKICIDVNNFLFMPFESIIEIPSIVCEQRKYILPNNIEIEEKKKLSLEFFQKEEQEKINFLSKILTNLRENRLPKQVENYLILLAYEFSERELKNYYLLHNNFDIEVNENKRKLISELLEKNRQLFEFAIQKINVIKSDINDPAFFYEEKEKLSYHKVIKEIDDAFVKNIDYYRYFLRKAKLENKRDYLELLKEKISTTKKNELKKLYMEDIRETYYKQLKMFKKSDKQMLFIKSNMLFITKFVLELKTLDDMYVKPLATVISESLKVIVLGIDNSKLICDNCINSEEDKIIYDNFNSLLYRLYAFNPHNSLFDKMVDYLVYSPVIKNIIETYKELCCFEDKEKLSLLCNNSQYISNSFKVYYFNSDFRIEEAKFLLQNIALEKLIVKNYSFGEITEDDNEDFFSHKKKGLEKDCETEISRFVEHLYDLRNIDEDLSVDIQMPLGERIRLLQRSIHLLNEVSSALKNLLPLPLFYAHDLKLNEQKEKFKNSISFVMDVINKDEIKIMDNFTLIKNKKDADSHTRVALIYEFANRTFQWPMAKELRPVINNDVFHDLNLNSNNVFTRSGFIKGLLLSMGFGYLAPFILGGNNDFWSYYKEQQWISAFALGLLMASLCYVKIKAFVAQRVGKLEDSKVFNNFGIEKRVKMLFVQSFVTAFIFSLLGLIIYAPPVLDSVTSKELTTGIFKIDFIRNLNTFNFLNIPRYILSNEIIIKYLLTFPFVSMFIGLYMENKLDE